ncbi:MAG TPA: Gfo/Idh/MocA family oxidoreductase [bacterium]|nr:Gfo/Idh/MocA family oxidoreductase [bacterium]
MSLGWGIIGTGGFAGSATAPAINALGPEGALVAAVSRDRSRADAFAAQHGARRAYTDYADLLRDRDVNIIYISTPNAQHAEQALAAARAGKHVLCEKPLALSAGDARRMVEAFEAAGLKLGTHFQTRHHTAFVETKRLLEQRAIGDAILVQIEVSSGANPFRTWRADPQLAGLGSINNIAVHPFDLLRYLLGSEVKEVTAMTDVGRTTELEHMALALLRFQNGTLAYVNANQKVPNFQPDIDIYGTAGRIVGIDCTRPFRVGELRVLTASGEQATKYSSNDAVVRSVAAFNDAVKHDREPNASGLDGLRSTQLTEAVIRSAREGRLVEVAY